MIERGFDLTVSPVVLSSEMGLSFFKFSFFHTLWRMTGAKVLIKIDQTLEGCYIGPQR